MSSNEEIDKLKMDFAVSQSVAKNNLKWGGISVAIILSFLGYNTFIALPTDAKKAAEKAVEERIDEEISKRLGEDIVSRIRDLNNDIVGLKSEAEKLTDDLKLVIEDANKDQLFRTLNSIQNRIDSLSDNINKYGVLSVDWAYGKKKEQRINGKENGKVISLNCPEPSSKYTGDNYLYIKRP